MLAVVRTHGVGASWRAQNCRARRYKESGMKVDKTSPVSCPPERDAKPTQIQVRGGAERQRAVRGTEKSAFKTQAFLRYCE